MKKLIKSFTEACGKLVDKILPDAYLFAVILTGVTFVMCLIFTDATAGQTFVAWGDGVWNLLEFTSQMATIMVFGYAFSKTPIMEKFLDKMCHYVKTPKQAYFFTSAASAILSWICWPAGLICGGFIALKLGRKIKKVHFPLLVASAYSGFLVFQNGLTGTHLILNTPGTWSEELVGLIPPTETFLTSWNLFISLILGVVVVPYLMTLVAPSDDKVIELDIDKVPEEKPREKVKLKGLAFNDWLENNYFINLFLGLALMVYIVYYFVNGGGLTINSTNLIFMALGILFTPTPIEFVNRCVEGAHTAGGVIMQFPIYAGIQGMMLTTGLASVIADGFVAISTAKNLPMWSFLSAGLVNVFIPSGGSQWVAQGPVMLEAAANLGADIPRTAMGVFLGNSWTNMIQPFWAIPLLSIANVKAKDIIGYLVPVLIASGTIITLVLVYWP